MLNYFVNLIPKMSYLYIISFANIINDNCFKIGVTGNPSVDRLLSRYRTYGDCIIIAFVSLINLNAFHYETLIRESMSEGLMIHGGTMVSEWVRIRYESLVLVIKAVLTLNMSVKIHSEHFIIDEAEEIVDKRFLEIPQRFRRIIIEPISFGNFEPNINDIYELLIPPSKLDLIDINQLFPKRDIVSMISYFISSANNTNPIIDQNIRLVTLNIQPTIKRESVRLPLKVQAIEQIPQTEVFIYEDFIRDCCVIGTDEKTLSRDLYDCYVQYTGTRADSSKVFKKNMEKIYPYANSNGHCRYKGIDIDNTKINDHNNRTQNYVIPVCADSFVYANFVRNCCVTGVNKKTFSRDLYNCYVQYTGIRADSNKLFKKNMEKVYPYASSNGHCRYKGIDIDIVKISEFNNNRIGEWQRQAIGRHMTLSVIHSFGPLPTNIEQKNCQDITPQGVTSAPVIPTILFPIQTRIQAQPIMGIIVNSQEPTSLNQ